MHANLRLWQADSWRESRSGIATFAAAADCHVAQWRGVCKFQSSKLAPTSTCSPGLHRAWNVAPLLGRRLPCSCIRPAERRCIESNACNQPFQRSISQWKICIRSSAGSGYVLRAGHHGWFREAHRRLDLRHQAARSNTDGGEVHGLSGDKDKTASRFSDGLSLGPIELMKKNTQDFLLILASSIWVSIATNNLRALCPTWFFPARHQDSVFTWCTQKQLHN